MQSYNGGELQKQNKKNIYVQQVGMFVHEVKHPVIDE